MQSKFVVSPPGLAFDCHRTYEVLMAGAIPIVMTSPLDRSLQRLPVVIVQDYAQLAQPGFLENQYAYLQGKLRAGELDFRRLTMPYWLKLQRLAATLPSENERGVSGIQRMLGAHPLHYESFTCQGVSDIYGTDHATRSFGTAPHAEKHFWIHHRCKTSPDPLTARALKLFF